MGHGSEGARKDRSNGEVPGSYLQGGGTVGANIWQWDLGGDQGYVQGPGRVPPLGGATDHGDDGKTQGSQRVGVPLVSGGNGSRWDPPQQGVHQEAEDDHSGECGLPPCIRTVHGDGADAWDDPDGAVVGSQNG